MHQYLVGQGYWSYIKERKKINPTQRLPNTQHGSKPQAASRVMHCLVTCVHDHMLGYIAEGGVGKSTKDFRREHNRKDASTPPRVEQHPTEGYVHHELHLENQGDLRLSRLDKHKCGR